MYLFIKKNLVNIFCLISIAIIVFANTAPAQIPCVSGFVTDPNGNPVIGADLDFDDAITGERIFTPGDNTDNSGFYTVCVFPGIYHISYAPPPNSNLLGKQYFNIDLSDGMPLELNVTLDFGKIISGVVSNSLGNPVGGVDLDADNLSTGSRIYTPDDNSDSLTGAYWIVVPADDYRLRFQPPQGSRWTGFQIDTIAVHSDTIVNVILEEGFLLSGNITNELNQGIPKISVGLRDQITGEKLYVANNKTDSLGFYNVAVPAGMFELRLEPPVDTTRAYVGVAIDSFIIAGDLVFNQVLMSGFIFTAVVHDSLNNPIAGADLDFILPGTGEKIFTPNDKTDSLGIASFAVLPDTYTIRIQPPPGTLFDRAILDSVIILSDTTFYFQLGEVQRVHLSGRVTDTGGIGLANIGINLINQTIGNNIFSADKITDTLGFYDFRVPIGTFDLVFIPSRGERFLAVKIPDITFMADTVMADIALESGFIFDASVFDEKGDPVISVDFGFLISGSGAEIFAPHNSTDAGGRAMAVLRTGTYAITLNPPPGTGYLTQHLNDFEIYADTSMLFIMQNRPGPLPNSFLLRQNAPNPFNQITSIDYFLFKESIVEIMIYDALGRFVKIYADGKNSAGSHTIIWDGTNGRGIHVSSGVYFYRIKTSFGDKTRKMLFIK